MKEKVDQLIALSDQFNYRLNIITDRLEDVQKYKQNQRLFHSDDEVE